MQERELKQALKEIVDDQVKGFLLENSCLFEFRMNPPSASHMSGVWERLIRSVRSILANLLFQHGSQLDDESLRTYMVEVAAIVNGRPLTLENFSDPEYPEPLTPNHLLTMKSKVIVSPPGEFQRDDIYSIKRWRRVQFLVNQFWNRWRSEYVQNLQSRSKWLRPRRDLKVGDIVVIKDELLPRNAWRLGRVSEVKRSLDNRVRSVFLFVGDRELDKNGKRVNKVVRLERPVHKLVLLIPNDG